MDIKKGVAIVRLLVVAVLILTGSHAFAQNERVYAIWGNPDAGRKVYAAKGKGATAPTPFAAVAASRAALETEALPALARTGLQVYEDQGCAACHTARGTGGAGGPDLTTVGRRRDAAWLTAFIQNPSATNPASEMPPYDTMTTEDMDALVAYLQTLK